jgi:hypothetical protein
MHHVMKKKKRGNEKVGVIGREREECVCEREKGW